MRRVCISLTLAVFLPLSAWADPVSVNLLSANGAVVSVSPSTNGLHIDMGQLQLTGAESSALFLFGGLNVYTDYTVLLNLAGSGLDSLTFEVLDIFGDGDDGLDPSQPSYVPSGYSTSNDFDGFSFAQNSGLTRSAVFAGGSATLTVDERTNRGDILIFSGLSGTDEVRINFGLRDAVGGRDFLVRLVAAAGVDAANAPEPASMLLLGTGLAGIAGAYRRRLLQARRA